MKKFLWLLLMIPLLASAEELKGIKVGETEMLGNQSLVLNGAGIRSKFIVDVYVVSLYLTHKMNTVAAVFADKGAKRIELHMLRDVKSSLFYNGLNVSIMANQTEADMKTLDPKVNELNSIIQSIPELKKDGVILLDYWPGVGTKVVINGETKGTIEGDEFYQALLKIWLGEHPVNHHLKEALLGHEA
ncbi:MAG TPA: chalcone isomerase family protein [Gallionellaceae bacterium]